MLRKFFVFIICLLPWFFSSVVPVDYGYYKEIILPWFAPPSIFYSIAWTIVYIFLAITITSVLESYKFKEIPLSYKISLLVNYLFNQSYILVFFGLKSNFLGFVSCLGNLISCLFLMNETYELKENSRKYFIPYILLSIFAVILSFTIYIINL